jgi:signal transduction histidine kinase
MWSTSHLRVGLDLERSPVDMPPDVAAGLYRIAQESLRNVVKHAGASTAMVRLARADGGVQLVVEDNGSGFDTAAPRGVSANGGSGMGLTSITERARQFGGRVAVQSRPGSGTRVVAWMPLGSETA